MKQDEFIKESLEQLLASYKMIANKRVLTDNEFVENAEKAIELLKQPSGVSEGEILRESIQQSAEYVKNIKEIEERGTRKLSYQDGFTDGAKWALSLSPQSDAVEWISVDEKPKTEGYYNVTYTSDSKHTAPAYWDGDDFLHTRSGNKYLTVTHWMPLPSPPKNYSPNT